MKLKMEHKTDNFKAVLENLLKKIFRINTSSHIYFVGGGGGGSVRPFYFYYF